MKSAALALLTAVGVMVGMAKKRERERGRKKEKGKQRAGGERGKKEREKGKRQAERERGKQQAEREREKENKKNRKRKRDTDLDGNEVDDGFVLLGKLADALVKVQRVCGWPRPDALVWLAVGADDDLGARTAAGNTRGDGERRAKGSAAVGLEAGHGGHHACMSVGDRVQLGRKG
jgi:hypothetical protein